MIGWHPAQPFQPVIGRTIEANHIQPRLNQRDERQEQLPVQPILVQLIRPPVGCRHHRDTRRQQGGEQPGQDHRIGDIVDLHLVKRQQPRLGCNCSGHHRDRVIPPLLPVLVDPVMHIKHELMKMRPPLGRHPDMLDEQVHQHRLAAPDRSPKINPARWRHRLGEQPTEQTGRWLRFQSSRQRVQLLRGEALFGVRGQFIRRNQRVIAGENATPARWVGARIAHAWRATLRSVPV